MGRSMINDKKRKLLEDIDILVIGGGTAGFAAAIASARNGAKVVILEQEDHLGGTFSGSMIVGLCSLRHQPISTLEAFPFEGSSYAGEQVVFGIAQEFLDRTIDVGAAWATSGQATTRVLIDPEIAKWVIDQMVTEAGVNVLLYTKVTDILKSNNQVKGIIIDSLMGKTSIEAKVIIDTTGDGNVCVAAGAEFEQGRTKDKLMQPLTLYFVIGGICMEETLRYLEENADEYGRDYVNSVLRLRKEHKPITLLSFKSKVSEAINNGEYPIAYGAERVMPDQFIVSRPVIKNGKIVYDVTSNNMDMAYYVDATDSLELTRAIIAMRDIAVKMSIFFRKYIPGYENSYLIQTAQRIGVRETRRIVGDYVLTGKDVLSGKTFDDAIGRYAGAVDIHDVDGGAKPISLTEIGGSGWYHIPYRILLPWGIDNLLVAGRCVSTDRIANGSLRCIPACILMGQAAGTAAALSVKTGLKPRDIDVSELQKMLVSQDVLI